MAVINKTFQYGKHQGFLETGRIARQSYAVIVGLGNTRVLCTAVGSKEAETGRDFFPLTVNYQEKSYAAGKIPGGYFKREGRPSEIETLTSRLIDRPIRPLFPDGFTNEVQVIATVLSLDPEVNPDIPAIIGCSAALAISGMPFQGPVGAARVGFKDGEYILNPSMNETESLLDLIVAGTKDAVLMVESEAKELTEEQMLGAVEFGHKSMQPIIDVIQALADDVGNPPWEFVTPVIDASLEQRIAGIAEAKLREAYGIKNKAERQETLRAIYVDVKTQLCTEEDESATIEDEVDAILKKFEKKIVRGDILAGKSRIDGRDTTTVRPINIALNELPSVHGSAVFTRGETQAICVTTLGTERDAQIVDALSGETRDAFMLHYNFPPYSVGEVGFMGSPKRREIGHGKLAKRALAYVLPTLDEFPYVIRAVSEITESNGSSSMATVCGTSLALMDAGVPIKSAVAGIAMGLIKESDQYAVLTDILGDEDHLGDMDFKVAGTDKGVTALQMDIKIQGITHEIMDVALRQAKDARLHILGIMNQSLDKPRQDVSKNAPRIISFKINPEKIRDVIGKGGSTIRELTESTGTTIDISDEGVIKIAAVDTAAGEEAKRRIESIVAEVEVGKIYEGPITRILDFGAFVEVLQGKTGLLHISQISDQRIENIHDHLQEGQVVKVKVLEIDRQGRIRLSMKEMEGSFPS